MRFNVLALATLALAAADDQRGAAADPVAEIVTFRLLEGSDPLAFVSSAQDMIPFLKSTEAMLTRTLSVDEAGLWTDHITWTSMQAALSAAEAMMRQPEAAPFMAMIDPETVQMRHAPISVSIKME